MEKDLFTGARLMMVKPEEQKRERVIVMRPNKPGMIFTYDPEALKKELQALRDFVAFDMAAELNEDASISAWTLSAQLMPLDYLIREVEFKEVEVLV